MAGKQSITISAAPEAPKTSAPELFLTHLQYADLEMLAFSLEEIACAAPENDMKNTLSVISLFAKNLVEQIDHGQEGGAE